MVLLREWDEEGFAFYTNTGSDKGRALNDNPEAALTFYWDRLQRQIRVQGGVAQVSADRADRYFAGRPRQSQLGAWASLQSRPLSGRAELEQRCAEFDSKFSGAPVPRPPHWTGFLLTPRRMEFWQEREYRLHDRFIYRRDDAGWKIDQLYP